MNSRGGDMNAWGVEISEDVAEWIRHKHGFDMRSGFFPGIELTRCDLFLAFDVFEHSPCPVLFLQEVARCLVPGGVAILQTAIDRYNFEIPFGDRADLFG